MSEDVHCECGETFDDGAGLAEHIDAEGADGHAPAADAGQAVEPDNTNTMNDTETLRDELGKIMPGSEPLKNLKVHRVGFNDYVVLSARNGSVTRHDVDLSDGSCTCEDATHNVEEGDREVCAHYVVAFLESDDVTTDELALNDLATLCGQANEARQEMHDARDLLNQAVADLRSEEASTTSDGGASDSEVAAQEPDNQSAMEAAERLQEAYDDVVDDMQVQASEGYIWIQTGKDTPDTLPGPGNVEPFDAFLSNPEQVTYVHDDHELADDKPGEWWKNAMEPGDVDEYIEEVLE